MNALNIVKIGGNIIDNPEALSGFIKDFAEMDGYKILVHGGGKEASRLTKDMGLIPQMIDGRRVTDESTIKIVTMVYAGLINKRIISGLQAAGCNSIGLTGADGNSIVASKRSPIPVDYGLVGDINPDNINQDFIKALLRQGITPVFCAIMHDAKGSLLNCNADSVASAIACAMSRMYDKTVLTYCFEQPGVMRDINNADSVIPHINESDFENLRKQGIINHGMIPKIENALNAVNSGKVSKVIIKHAKDLLNNIGTVISQ